MIKLIVRFTGTVILRLFHLWNLVVNLMVQLMVKCTGRIIFAFILPVNFNSKIDSKICW